MYDIIIIGAGMAGLFAAFRLARETRLSFLVLEAADCLGGRALNTDFQGARIAPGAGIGRAGKDKMLAQLMTDVGLPVKEFPFKPHYARTPVDVLTIFAHLREVYDQLPIPRPRMTFAQFGKRVLGEKLFREFVFSTGYTDYLRADVADTLYDYGMDDNACCWKGFGVDWKGLTERMGQVIDSRRIRLGINVQALERTRNGLIEVMATDRNQRQVVYQTRNVVIATTIDTIRALLPHHEFMYRQIEGQPFMRVFAQFDPESRTIMKQMVPRYTVVPAPLQKIIPIDAEKGIYMIAYNDNQNAKIVRSRMGRPREMERILERALKLPAGSLHIRDIAGYYWPIGTHFYQPLQGFKTRREFVHHAQRPHPNVWVVGEAVSMNQGWVEGALDSVQTVWRDIVA